jgi:hypothetical protein
VQPETNQSNSVVTARRSTRFVVRSGRIGIRESESEGLLGLGFDSEKRSVAERRGRGCLCLYDLGGVHLQLGCGE